MALIGQENTSIYEVIASVDLGMIEAFPVSCMPCEYNVLVPVIHSPSIYEYKKKLGIEVQSLHSLHMAHSSGLAANWNSFNQG